MPEVGQKQLSTLPGGPTGYDQTPGTRTPSPCTKISPGVIQQLVPITTDRASGADSDAPETVQLIITEYKMQTAVTYRGVSKPRGWNNVQEHLCWVRPGCPQGQAERHVLRWLTRLSWDQLRSLLTSLSTREVSNPGRQNDDRQEKQQSFDWHRTQRRPK